MNTRPQLNRWSIIAALAVALLLMVLFWLQGPWNSQNAASGLLGKTWHLTAINGNAAVEGSSATLVFEQNRVSGNASVNSYGGSYKVNGNTLTFSELISTMMASADPALNQQEQTFLSILQGQLTYTLTGKQLELRSPQGTLTFRS